jgi:hypothetical protein
MTNKMLLSSSQEEGIPYKPFPEGEEKIVFLTTEIILNPAFGFTNDGGFYNDTFPFDKSSGIQLPKNHCTIIFGITDEAFADYVNKHNGIQQQEQINVTVDFYALVDREGNTETIMFFSKSINVANWSASYEEIRVQLDFTSKNYVFYPSALVGPILAKYTLSNGNEVISYPNAYVRISNEIHELGPQKILTIDNKA